MDIVAPTTPDCQRLAEPEGRVPVLTDLAAIQLELRIEAAAERVRTLNVGAAELGAAWADLLATMGERSPELIAELEQARLRRVGIAA